MFINIMFDQLNIIYPLIVSVFIFMLIIITMKIIKYEQALKEKNLSIIQFYLDKKFLNNHLIKSFETPKSQNYVSSFLENVKFYFKLDDIKVVSRAELESDKELNLLFKEKLENLTTSLFSKASENIKILCQVLDSSTNTDHVHRLYVYLPPEKINEIKEKNFVYIKASYKFTEDEMETLDIYIHLAQLFAK